jgi:hypothetical protein
MFREWRNNLLVFEAVGMGLIIIKRRDNLRKNCVNYFKGRRSWPVNAQE